MPPVPSALELDLFRAVEDVQELTSAVLVLLVDEDGGSVAVSGDEDDLPPAVRRVLSGRRLREAGSARELLAPIASEIADSRLNLTILDVDGSHVLAIVFDAQADLETVQVIGGQGRATIADLLASAKAV